MELAHKIQLRPTAPQEAYFRQAAGCARFTRNWAVAHWTEDFEAGHAPTWSQLKKRFNAIKYEAFPWMKGVHRDAHAQPFANLGKTAKQFFSDMLAGKNVHKPQFKKKGQCLDSFYVANDKFAVKGSKDRRQDPQRHETVRLEQPATRCGGLGKTPRTHREYPFRLYAQTHHSTGARKPSHRHRGSVRAGDGQESPIGPGRIGYRVRRDTQATGVQIRSIRHEGRGGRSLFPILQTVLMLWLYPAGAFVVRSRVDLPAVRR